MNEGQKPFACVVEGCEMTFTNEDHLNWHRKKHDMVLNLGLANKNNEVADQTPTPTRFIRNCEEVGLFQDLQNVNPFDEFFKKAVEITKSGGTLEVHEINSEDTLHTPHILPHIEENQKKTTPTSNINEDDHSHPDEFTLNNMILITDNSEETEKRAVEQISEPIIEIHEDTRGTENLTKNYESKSITSTATNAQNEGIIQKTDVKLKIKQTLQIRGKQKNIHQNVSSKNIIVVDSNSKSKIHLNNSDLPSSPLSKEKIRAMNRAAQVRCRKRKAQRWKEMEEELEHLKVQNKKLKLENSLLKKELIIMGNTFGSKNNKNGIEAVSPSDIPETTQQPGNDSTNSIIIKILPSNSPVPLIPLGILPKQTSDNSIDKKNESVTKSRNLRKIIPKIVIDKC